MPEPGGLAALLAAAALYACGVTRVWRKAGRGRFVRTHQVVCGAGAWLGLAAALVGPLDAAAGRSLAWHMAQHVALMMIVPPLLAESGALAAVAHVLPPDRRRALRARGRALGAGVTGSRWALWAAGAIAVQAAAVGLWHLPVLFDAARAHEPVHAVEHACLLGTSTLLWRVVLGAGRRSRPAAGILVVFVASLPATALGVVMALAATPWYAGGPAGRPARLVDQQVGGAVMWGFGGLAAVVAAAAVFASWLGGLERATPARPSGTPRRLRGEVA